MEDLANPAVQTYSTFPLKYFARTMDAGYLPRMRKIRNIDDSGHSSTPQPAPTPPSPGQALQKTEKGSHRSMWEVLLQLRVLLPYLSHLAPLLERTSKGSPEVNQVSRALAVIQAGSREIETLTRNQTHQLERMEERLAHFQVVHQQTLEESRTFFAEMRAFRRWMTLIAVVIGVLVGATAGLVAFMLLRP